MLQTQGSHFQNYSALNHNQLTPAEEKEAVSTHEYQPIPLEECCVY